jgi:uncharacterized protein YkwD
MLYFQTSAQTPLPEEAQKAYLVLNKIRQNPSAWSEKCGVDLSYVEPRPALAWNDILAQVATEKAIDMATRGYFAHLDPDGYGLNIKMHEAGYTLIPDFIDNISNFNFDNLSAQGEADGEVFIYGLINDEGVNPPGHRNAMLGIVDFWANCTDVGIGIVKGQEGSQYGAYAVVIVAKHDF